jgi:hypothetical protein
MTTRERIITIFLGGFIFVAVAGFLYFVFYARPMSAVQDSIDAARADVAKKRNTLEVEKAKNKLVTTASPRLEKWQDLSLPEMAGKDANKATAFQKKLQGDYLHILDDVMREAGFAANNFTITPKELPKKSNTAMSKGPNAQKGPPYTAMSYTVTAKGPYKTVLTAMEKLYKVPVLHEIKSFTLEKEAETRGNQTKSQDLKATFVVETLQVEGADKKRETALPSTPPSVAVLADGREYLKSLIKYDMFFGKLPDKPVPVTKTVERLKVPPEAVAVAARPPDPKTKVEDIRYVLGVIKLTQLAHNGNRWEAFYYDQGVGGHDRMLNMRLNRFEFKDKYDNVLVSGEVINLSTTRGLYFRADDKHVYRWGIGEYLDDALRRPLGVVAENKNVMLLKGVEEIDGLAVMSLGDTWSPFPPRPATDFNMYVGLAGALATPVKVNDGVTVASRNAAVAEKLVRRVIVEEKPKPEEKPAEPGEEKPGEEKGTEKPGTEKTEEKPPAEKEKQPEETK